MFIDKAKIVVSSGKGGDGHVSFRREKYVPAGGPDGGDGGNGGSVIFEVDEGLNTLADFRHIRKYQAQHGEPGKKRRCTGRTGEDMIIKAPSHDIMNKLGRSILTLYSYDDDPETMTLENQLRLAMQLIARTPMIVAHGYAAKRCYFDKASLYIHRAQPGKGTAENILAAIREDQQYTEEEARLLDLCLMLHAEHGGGNNSTFTCRVISSSYTDIFSSIAAAVGSLKGPRHGGANIKCKQMMDYIAQTVKDWKDDDEVAACIANLLRGRGYDHSGLVYGMGHAVYTLSDPRAKVLKRFSRTLAEKRGMGDRLELIERVERITPQVFSAITGKEKIMCANVDLYSGFVYDMLGIPEELYTPLFATARMVGWCAHRMEEIFSGSRIIRPAYKAVGPKNPFVPLDDRL